MTDLSHLFEGGPVAVLAGDCLESVAGLPPESVDAVVTDPPYHLASIVKRFGPGQKEAQHGTDGLFRRASKGFLGKEWDGGDLAFRPETWAAFLRVAKPGAHLVAFNHSRTFHHMAVAIEAAGWQIRDTILDLYAAGDAWSAFLDTLTPAQAGALSAALGGSSDGLLAWVYGSGFPKSHDVAKGIDKLREDGAAVRRVTAWLAAARDRAGLSNRDLDAAFGFNGMGGHWTTQGAQAAVPTPEQWARLLQVIGVDAAAVPEDVAAEVVRLNARKGTPGEAWAEREFLDAPTGGLHGGTGNTVGRFTGRQAAPGAVREDAARWEGWATALKPAFEPVVLARKPLSESSVARQVLATGTGALNVAAAAVPPSAAEAAEGKAGRWPANVAHDGSAEVVARFPRDASGSVSRFFYCGKADASDRAGSEHPTVKPHDLMRWLVRLVAAPGAVILDPFGGSGATGWAAAAEGVRCILCEREPDYLPHLRARAAALGPAGQAAAPEPDALPGQLSLFGGEAAE